MPQYTTGVAATTDPNDPYRILPRRTRTYMATGAEVGSRNRELSMAAQQFRDAGFDKTTAESVLMPRAVADGLEEVKARKCVASIYKRPARGAATGGASSASSVPHQQRPASTTKPLPSPIPDAFKVIIDACFLPGERAVIGKGSVNAKGDLDINGGTMNKVEAWLHRVNGKTIEDVYPSQKDGLFLRINPMKGQGKADADVDAFRHALVEFDEDKNGVLIPKELQYNWLIDSGLPISAIVDSGKRSLQGWARVDAPDRAEYYRRCGVVISYFQSVCDGFDDGNKNPSRYCRCPGVPRNLYDKSGVFIRVVRQELLAVKVGSASWDEWEKARSASVDYTDEELQEIARERTERLTKKEQPFPASMAPVAYYGIAGEVVRMIAEGAEPCPESILLQFLVGFGNILGRAPYFKQAAIHHLNEFCVLVGETARSRKGTAWASVRNLLESVDMSWTRSRIRGGFPSGESIVHAVRDGATTGIGKRKIYDPGVSDKRLLMFEGEFARFLENCSRRGCTLSSVMREVWDSPEVLYVSGKTAPEEATGAHISFIGHVTQQDLMECLREVENKNGFSNRILWCAARSVQQIADPVWIEWNDPPQTAIVDRLKIIVQTFHASATRRLTWSKSGLVAWRTFYNEIKPDAGGILGSIIARDQPHIGRLTAIYTALDHSTVMEPRHLEAAIAVWDYCERSAQWVFGQKTGNRKADQIYWALLHDEAGLQRLQIIEDVFSRNISKTTLDQALSVLLDAKLVVMVCERAPGAKRHTERWIAVSAK